MANLWSAPALLNNLEGYFSSESRSRAKQPPLSSFCIERHGGKTKGSVFADLHSWTADLNKEAAFCYPFTGRRQVKAKLPRLDAKPLVEEVVRSILGNTNLTKVRFVSAKQVSHKVSDN